MLTKRYSLRYDYEYQSTAGKCKLKELLASYGNGSVCPGLFDQFFTNLISSSLASRNSSYPYAPLTRCSTTASQLGLAWLL